MQLKLNFKSDQDIIFDENNIRVIQGIIYKKLDEIGARYIHNGRFKWNKKEFRHFCFSGIISKNTADKGIVNHGREFSIIIATALKNIVEDLCNAFYTEKIVCQDKELYCQIIEVLDTSVKDNIITVISQSPIVIDKTTHHNGKKTRRYYAPDELGIESLIKNNLIDKHNSLYKKKLDHTAQFKILQVDHLTKIEKKYQKPSKRNSISINIVGYHATLTLTGDPKLLKMALNSGLGSKNSQGFGLVTKMNNLIKLQ